MVKIIFTNPFASPKLEDEMMPVIDTAVIEEKKPKTTRKKPVARKKSSVTKKKVEVEIDEPVVEEILELEAPIEEILSDETEASDVESKEVAVKTSKSGVEIVKELEENSKLMDTLEKGKVEKPKNFKLPKLDFLQKAPKKTKKVNEAEIDRKSGDLIEKLKLFKIDGDVVRTYTGPLVTTFEFKPAPHVKVSKILGLQDDLAMALSAETIRIQAPIPGRDVVGIEIPNESADIIYLREILESELFQNSKSPLTIALGKDIVGKPFITDIKKLPHLLIAGTTGSGKSVGINAMILSLLYKNDPEHLKLMMIDPKMLEFSIYDEIPHLITPVITEPKKAIAALANMVGEMERRYRLMADKKTKNIDNYNEKVKKDGSGDEPMPFIVIIIDELADLMMNGGKEVETSIARLAQKSRACGIHLIVATQRPSVDVVTGIIKANLPSRLSYRVGQKIDSKVILDSMGADSLLGRGDGLFTPPGTTGLVRIHAPWATEEEIEEIVEFIKAQRAPEYDESYLIEGGGASLDNGDKQIDLDPLYEEAKAVVLSDKKTSISYLQRKLQIGYNRSANIIEQLEATGVLSAPNAKGNRDILI
jgi:S-DNA-T family DNA segregation ATPase FtsK/SpoIIIE